MKQKLKKYGFFGFLLGILFLSVSIQQTQAAPKNGNGLASLLISPSSGSFELRKTFSVDVKVASKAQAMNAASGVISFPKDKLEVVSISKNSKSIINLWAEEPSFSNDEGLIRFGGIVLNPGFHGASGKILTVKFKAKAKGDATVKFSSGTVLANDGNATNITSKLGSAEFNIAPRAISNSSIKLSPKSSPPAKLELKQNEIIKPKPAPKNTKLRASPKNPAATTLVVTPKASVLAVSTKNASAEMIILVFTVFLFIVIVLSAWRRYRLNCKR